MPTMRSSRLLACLPSAGLPPALRIAVAACLACALAGCGNDQPISDAVAANAGPVPAQPHAHAPQRTDAMESRLPDFTSLVARQGPAVVNVITTRRLPEAGAPQGDPVSEFLRRFAPDGAEPEIPRDGLGSGFIISAD